VQFGGYDGSIVVNHAWQLHLGYQPYVDVVTGLPPLFLIGSHLAFDFWGVHWYVLVMIAAFFSAVTFLLQVALLLRLNFGARWSLLLPFAIQSMTMVPVAWWWYNQVTAVLGCLFVSAALLLYQRPNSVFSQGAFAGSAVLLALAKPNMASALLVSVFVLLISAQHLRRRVIVLFTCATAVTLGVLFWARVNPLDVLTSYTIFAGDALSLSRIAKFLLLNDRYEVGQTFALMAPSVLAVGIVLFRVNLSPSSEDEIPRITITSPTIKKMEVPCLALGLISRGGGILGMMTNNEYNMSDASMILLGSAVITLLFRGRLAIPRMRVVVLALIIVSTVLLTANGLRYTMFRWRVMGVGPGAFYEEAPLTVLEDPALFKGMSVGPRLVRVLSDIEETLKTAGYLGPEDAPVFFGPRIDFGYAAYGIHPHPGLPTWWEFFSQDGRGQTNDMVERFKAARFKLCIFLRRDYTFFPASLIEYLNQAYEVYDTGELTIHVLRPEGQAP